MPDIPDAVKSREYKGRKKATGVWVAGHFFEGEKFIGVIVSRILAKINNKTTDEMLKLRLGTTTMDICLNKLVRV
jgi:hypothetical protein